MKRNKNVFHYHREDGSVKLADETCGASCGGSDCPDASVCAAAWPATQCYLQTL